MLYIYIADRAFSTEELATPRNVQRIQYPGALGGMRLASSECPYILLISKSVLRRGTAVQ